MAEIFNTVAGGVPAVPRHQLVLVDGRTFAISDEAGEMVAPTHGLVHDDVRYLSRLHVTIDDAEVEVLASTTPTPLSAVVVGRISEVETDGGPRPPGLLTLQRWVAGGLRQDIRLQNSSPHERRFTLRIEVRADFAHVFDVKAGLAGPGGYLTVDSADRAHSRWSIQSVAGDHHSTIAADPPPDDVVDSTLGWNVVVGPRSHETISMTVEPVAEGIAAGLAFPCGIAPVDAVPMRRLDTWRAMAPVVTADDTRLATVVDQALTDLASLRIFDQGHPTRPIIAAGAPWFMTLFGRDSLLSAWMTLPFDPSLAVGVLHALAELQGVVDDPAVEEQPGKILHELRRRGGGGPFSTRERYYGTVDATPLFVMLAGEAHRWGALSRHDLDALAPAVDRALSWVLGAGDSNRDGFLDYERKDPAGLSNQGWKDSWDGVTRVDGTIPSPPIAVVEAQGYAYAALRSAIDLAEPMRLRRSTSTLRRAAAALRHRFNQAYWDPQGWFALALDGSGRRVDAMTTNPGHALWTGIAHPALAHRYLDRLMEPDMWTGWGLRTLASTMDAYDPLSYHNGSVWPHDTAICAAGAARYGRWDVVDRIIDGALDAAIEFAGRPPELFAGIARADAPVPVAYPSSCSPQAWSSASVLLNLRTMLGLHPHRGSPRVGRVDLRPLGDLRLERLVCADAAYDIVVRDHVSKVERSIAS
jgi:glycogen debranching enzyme